MQLTGLAGLVDPVALVGYAAAATVFASFCTSTMVPLRGLALLSNVLFATYGYTDSLYPVLILHLALLPVNVWRLAQVLRLVRSAAPAQAGFDFDLLRPHMTERHLRAGETLFRRGDPADAMFLIDAGGLVVSEFGIARGPGDIVGEMGILSRTRRRTASVVARTDCVLQMLTAAKLRELWFQHPGFTLLLTQVLTDRLIDAVAEAADHRARHAPAVGGSS